MDSYDTHKPAYGSAYNVPNGKKHITLHLSVWHTRPDSILASSTGYGQWIRVGEDAPRKSFAAIQQLTAKYTDADIMLLCDPRKHDCDSALLAC